MSFAANQAPVISWKDPSIGITIGMGLLVMLAFFYVETKITAHPLLPYKRLNSDIGLILGCVACGWACFGIFLYYIWQFFELLRGASPLLASAWYSTNGVSGFVAAVLTGIFLGRVGPPLAMVLAMLAFVVGTIFIGTAPVDQTYWAQSFLCLLIIPFGMDISFPAATIIISDGLPPDEQGIGASLVNTVVNYSISVGLGMAALVEVNVRSEGPEGLLRGYRGAWYTGIGLSGLGLVISIFFWVRSRKRARTYTCTSTMRDDKP